MALVVGVVFLLIGLASPAGERTSTTLGKKVANVNLSQAIGKGSGALYDYRGKQAVVVAFLSFECPVSTQYSETLADLARAYGKCGVAFVGVCLDDETAAPPAKQQDLPFPVFSDQTGAVVKAFGATTIPEVFVLDRNFVLRYGGRIDDRYADRLKRKASITRHDLRQALDELLAGKPVSRPATQAVGCPIAQPQPRKDGKVTFYRDVLPILQQHCQACHRRGEVAPFPLMTYRQALRWAQDIKEYTCSRKMPPWKPVEGGAFLGDRRMPDKDIQMLAAWVDEGSPAGDPKDAPPPRRFPQGWQLGTPDLVLTVADDFDLGGSGHDVYRCFVLPTNLPEDHFVAAVEVRPGNRRVAHHALLFADRRGQGRKLEEQSRQRDKKESQNRPADRGPGYTVPLSLAFLPGFIPTGSLGGWAPGLIPRSLPKGAAYFLPKGADVVLQVHYHRSGRAEKDRTAVGLYFTKDPATRRLQGLAVPASFLAIPAGVKNHRVQGRIWLRQDCKVYAIMPHMHLLGRQIKVAMTVPGGKTRTLVAIDDWDFNWQEDYFFKEPISAPAGTRFDVEGVYDNSADNPHNPFQPPRPILAGLQTVNEMCVGFLGATTDVRGPIRFDIGLRLPGVGWLPGGPIPGFGL
jgi:peroxiredoxin